MSAGSEKRSRPAALYALPLTVLAVMGGLVLAANPGHYGIGAIAVGSATSLVGLVLTVRLFRVAEVREAREGRQAREGHEARRSARHEVDPSRIQETEGEMEV